MNLPKPWVFLHEFLRFFWKSLEFYCLSFDVFAWVWRFFYLNLEFLFSFELFHTIFENIVNFCAHFKYISSDVGLQNLPKPWVVFLEFWVFSTLSFFKMSKLEACSKYYLATFFLVCSGLAVKLLAYAQCTCPPLLGIWPLSDPPLVSPTDRLSLKREWRTNSRCIQKARDHETHSTGGCKVWSLSTTINRHFVTSNKQLNNWL